MILVFIAVGIVPLTIFSLVMINTYEKRAVNDRIMELQTQENMLSNLLATTGYLATVDSPEIEAEISRLADIYNGRIIIINNNLQIIKDTYGLEQGKYLISKDVLQGFNGTTNSYRGKDKNIKITSPVTHNQSNEVVGVIIMSISTKEIESMRTSLQSTIIIFALTLAILIIVFAVYFSRSLTKPLKSVINSIERLSEGYMEEQMSVKGYTEVERISDSFNKMIIRMQKLESSRQEFVSNVSHELKTPITSIKVLADSLLMQEDTPVELYREFLVDITDEIERENKIINDLLSLVKLDKTAGDLNISSTNINELLEQILKRLRPIAKKRNVEMIFESFRPVIADVDEVKISLAISNLIENAIKYNLEDGWVRVSLNADHKYFFIKVSDSGIGIPEEAQDYIFERFYRVDKARSRETGGTGLGLSITKNVIQMHRGAIKVYSKEGEGTTFNVRIPLNYIL
ncbi:MAG: hypothetical protein K0S47_1494 [Herbinix sp.]|jgi:signal transduction histidine kinase|nr:hypothetical protein [Herbinix sp.]